MKIVYALPFFTALSLSACNEEIKSTSSGGNNSNGSTIILSHTDTTIPANVELDQYSSLFLQDSLYAFDNAHDYAWEAYDYAAQVGTTTHDCFYSGTYTIEIESLSTYSGNGHVHFNDCEDFTGISNGTISVTASGKINEEILLYNGSVTTEDSQGNIFGFKNLNYLAIKKWDPSSRTEIFSMNLTALLNNETEEKITKYSTKENVFYNYDDDSVIFPTGFIEIEGISTTIGYDVEPSETYLNGELQPLGLGFLH